MSNILIIGGSRFVGPYLIEELTGRGHAITVFNRGHISSTYPAGIQFIGGDRDDGFHVREKFDVVIDMCAYTGSQTERALKELSFDFFVHFGTAAAYQRSEIFPLTENSPLGPWPVWGDYNHGKVECEKALQKSGAKYASIRPLFILGPANYADRELFIYSHIAKDTPIMLPGNGQALIQFVSVRDVALCIASLVENRTEGAFNCAGDDVISLKGMVELMAALVGKKPRIEYNPLADGAQFNMDEFPFANENFFCSNEKFKKTGMNFTPLATMLRKDYEEYYKGAIKKDII